MSKSAAVTGDRRSRREKEASGIEEVTGGRGVLQKGEGDKVNCVPNHCQTVGIRPGNLPINLN